MKIVSSRNVDHFSHNLFSFANEGITFIYSFIRIYNSFDLLSPSHQYYLQEHIIRHKVYYLAAVKEKNILMLRILK